MKKHIFIVLPIFIFIALNYVQHQENQDFETELAQVLKNGTKAETQRINQELEKTSQELIDREVAAIELKFNPDSMLEQECRKITNNSKYCREQKGFSFRECQELQAELKQICP